MTRAVWVGVVLATFGALTQRSLAETRRVRTTAGVYLYNDYYERRARALPQVRVPEQARSPFRSGLAVQPQQSRVSVLDRSRRDPKSKTTSKGEAELPAIYSGKYEPRQYFMRYEQFRPARVTERKNRQ